MYPISQLNPKLYLRNDRLLLIEKDNLYFNSSDVDLKMTLNIVKQKRGSIPSVTGCVSAGCASGVEVVASKDVWKNLMSVSDKSNGNFLLIYI